MAGKNAAGERTRKRIMAYIVQFKRANDGIPPTWREIMEACYLGSTSVVAYHLEILREEGKIVYGRFKNRNIMIPGGEWSYDGKGVIHDQSA